MSNVCRRQEDHEFAQVLAECRAIEARIISRRGRHTFTLADLHRYFDAVKNAQDWLGAIDQRIVIGADRDIVGTQEAIRFFLGSEALIAPAQASATAYPCAYRVTARAARGAT